METLYGPALDRERDKYRGWQDKVIEPYFEKKKREQKEIADAFEEEHF